jgi:hypothetical protein
MLTPADLTAAGDVCAAALRDLAASPADWDRPAGTLTWSARKTLDHIPNVMLFYAAQLATRAERRVPHVRDGDPVRSVAELAEVVAATATVLAEVAAAAGPGARATHPAGLADQEGWIAMGCDELLIHTGDIADGLGAAFEPPEDLCGKVVTRLFPWAPTGHAAWPTLRWANGRAALPGQPDLGPDWWWHCAPLDEWDGQIKRRTSPPGWI